MSVQFFQDFYKLDASHVRTRDFEIMTKSLADYKVHHNLPEVFDKLSEVNEINIFSQ
jgi:hypothetical protein